MNNPLESNLSTNRFQSYRQLPGIFYSTVTPKPIKSPHLVEVNKPLADYLGLDGLAKPKWLDLLSGRYQFPEVEPLAMKYTGHQFGYYNPDLGDGRGLLMGEIIAKDSQRWDLHLKGAGRTPYSRMGDGRAVLRSTIREYLCSEAMYGLGIPTTRALALAGSREPVHRETIETAATLIRATTCHIRFGHFEFARETRDPEMLQQLADYVIDRYFPELSEKEARYAAFFAEVVRRTACLIADWQLVGFNHGVMNTDNMSVIGETFDYGPYAFLDDFQIDYICNHSDGAGRYAFNAQPGVGLWNCEVLGNALSLLVSDKQIMSAMKSYEPTLQERLLSGFRRKLGLTKRLQEDSVLIRDLLNLLHQQRVDYTVFFRQLAEFEAMDIAGPARDLFIDRAAFDNWATRYESRLQLESRNPRERSESMKSANPKYILRNYLAQQAITGAESGDFTLFHSLLTVLSQPFDEHPDHESLSNPPPDQEKGIPLSCSS